MKYSHEKSFGNCLVFEWENAEIVLSKAYVKNGPPHFGTVGAIFRPNEVTQLQHDSYLFREAVLLWNEKVGK